jgi:hypothetical protein
MLRAASRGADLAEKEFLAADRNAVGRDYCDVDF